MTQKSAPGAKIAVAVAPIDYGFLPLGEALQEACHEAGLTTNGTVRMLGSEDRWAAVELDVNDDNETESSARAHLETRFKSIADVALIPAANRQKRLLISDMDSTIIEQECLDELAAFAGLKDEIAAITARAMAGELDFEGALTERVGKLAGLSLGALSECYQNSISLMPGARTLTETMRTYGAHCVLVSGGFTYFTQRVAEAAGFHDHRGNTLLDDGNALTGKVGMPILGRAAKLEALDAFTQKRGLARQDALAMGDGANDLAMIEAAGLGLAVHAKPVVAAASDAAINVTNLTAALYFQGYSDSDIVWKD